MKTHELLRILKEHGCYLDNHAGNHDMYYSPITGKIFPVWRHKGEMLTKTVHFIFKEAGIK